MNVAELASMVSAICAAAALAFTGFQIRTARINNKEIVAKQIFANVLLLPLEYPEIQDSSKFGQGDLNFDEQYKAYVRALLFASEEILELAPSDRGWELAVERNIDRHLGYLSSRISDPSFRAAYCDSLIRLIERMLA